LIINTLSQTSLFNGFSSLSFSHVFLLFCCPFRFLLCTWYCNAHFYSFLIILLLQQVTVLGSATISLGTFFFVVHFLIQLYHGRNNVVFSEKLFLQFSLFPYRVGLRFRWSVPSFPSYLLNLYFPILLFLRIPAPTCHLVRESDIQ